MHPLVLLLACALSCTAVAPRAAAPAAATPAPPAIDHPGCFLLARVDGSEATVVHPDECDVATAPNSTFKIPHALVALQLGVVTDPDAAVKWDGSPYWNPAWQRDHSLRSAIRESVVWYFQRTAEQIGRERMAQWLATLHYGNADVSGPIRRFWLDEDSLRIDGHGQLAFMQALFAGTLPFDPAHVRTVVSAMTGTIDDWRARLPPGQVPPPSTATFAAKTGTGSIPEGHVTWWAGQLDGPRGEWVFVSRVRGPGEPSSTSAAVHEGMRALATAGVL